MPDRGRDREPEVGGPLVGLVSAREHYRVFGALAQGLCRRCHQEARAADWIFTRFAPRNFPENGPYHLHEKRVVTEKSDNEREAAMPHPDTSARALPAPPPSSALLAVVAEAKPVQTRRPARTVAGIVSLSVACGLSLVVWALGLRKDLGSIPTLPLVLYAAACLASFGGQLVAALVPPPGQVLPTSRSTGMTFVLLAITVSVGLVLGVRAHPGTPVAWGHTSFWSAALPCLVNGLVVAVVPATLGMRALRQLIPRGSWRTALAVGGACGVLAGLALELHCPRVDLVHVGLAHGAVMVLPALLLAVIGVRALGD